MEFPLVSIVLTSYNQPELLEIAFVSLITQTYKNIEIIIVDDCSTDPANHKLILGYQAKYPDTVRYILHTVNNGIAKNKNSGFKVAKGEYITFLDGDDRYFPEKIESEMNLFRMRPNLDVVYSNFLISDYDEKHNTVWAAGKMPEGNVFEQLVEETFPGGIIFRFELAKASVYRENNFYDESMPIYHDWDFRIRYAINCKVGYLDKILSVYRRNEESITLKSSLKRTITDRIQVIKKNEHLINSRESLKKFTDIFKKKSAITILFDRTLPLNEFVLVVFKALAFYPGSVKEVLKSIKYRY